VTTVNLQESNIKEDEAYHIAHMLETNKVIIIILFLSILVSI
jgi:hypothetical protein